MADLSQTHRSEIDTTGHQTNEAACTVYYDGACPLCQREIALYQSMEGSDAIRWHDVSVTGTGASDLETADAMARFHVRRADGSLVSGARGFFEVMKTLPRLRWLGSLLSVPPIPWIAEGAYRLFLPLRPTLKKLIAAPKQAPRNDAA
ncbi:MAG: DUF393 domain-containing protein [Pseudomonadota bacterium]